MVGSSSRYSGPGAPRGPAGQLGGQLDPLGLAAGQRGGRLAQADVAQAHVAQGLQAVADAGVVPEEVQRLGTVMLSTSAMDLLAQGYLQRLPVVAAALAHLAGDGNVGQELHLNLVVALALAGLAASALDVEGEAAGLVTPDSSLGQAGEDLADGGERAGVGGGVAAGRAADGRLVDVDHLVDVLDAGDRRRGRRECRGPGRRTWARRL